MKKRLNLFSEELLPPKLQLSFSRLTKVCVALIVIFGVAGGLLIFSNHELQAQSQQLTAQKNQLTEQKTTLETQVNQRKPDAALISQVELMTERLKLKGLMLDELKRRGTAISQGFSPLLFDLASVSAPKLWLDRIKVDEDKFGFEGYSVKAQTVPYWIEQLKTTDTLRGYAFASMTMNRGDGKPIAFNLSSKPQIQKEVVTEKAK
ncbi:hypothetical protein NFHSH190041_05320 [Shewanella sp. NFH-SH190041]|uniref:fimbrial assembly protein n=1 Tax=Shewanella sp. NFH-SH190041 TaxID=2950245 RepID=UPI0021C42BD8|nr:fimbrial assembly protein [Shewanella sp. NFH-SH190041]BDM63080.1 hypothetical protein NFHSH190041_05320 [Shewanella sp. NFH-SH190041]